MKIKGFLLALMLTVLSAISCSKDDGGFVGSYTYKTSGTLSLVAANLSASATAPLYPEQGQLNVVKDGDEYILTFNNLLGGGDVARAKEEDGVLKITSTSQKTIQIVDATSEKVGGGIVSFTAEGRKYDGVLLIDFTFSGGVQMTATGAQLLITGTDVNCIAKKN